MVSPSTAQNRASTPEQASAAHNKPLPIHSKPPPNASKPPTSHSNTATGRISPSSRQNEPSPPHSMPSSPQNKPPTARNKASAARDAVFSQLAIAVARDKNLLQDLEQSYIAEKRVHFTAALQDLLPQESHVVIKDVWSGFATYCKEHADEVPLMIYMTFKQKDKLHNMYRHRRSHFALSVGMVPKAKGLKLAGIPTIHLAKTKTAYPPRGHDIYETAGARQIWEDFQARTLYPDRRGGKTWKPLHELDPNHLQHTVGVEESVIIRDTRTDEIIGVVIRDFSNNNQQLLDWINGIIEEGTGSRQSVRLEDPGKLCQIGYTSGARSMPQLGWARNLLRKQTDKTVTRLMYESSSVFALFWNILRNQLPEEINSDFDTWLEENNMVRMDTKGSQTTVQGEYTVKHGNDLFVFHEVDMPPPSGVFGTNYSRFIHREGSGHKYAVAWTTFRDPKLGREWGGNFFICSHGIKVEAATDTVVVWKPRSWHGTSLQERDPDNPEIFQSGLAIVTPPGIAKLWVDVCNKKVTLEEARKKALDLESDELDK